MQSCGAKAGAGSPAARWRLPHCPEDLPLSSAVEYRDTAGGLWLVSEVARLNLVSPAIDGPNVFLVLRFEREGEERFVRWLGDPASAPSA